MIKQPETLIGMLIKQIAKRYDTFSFKTKIRNKLNQAKSHRHISLKVFACLKDLGLL